jgi:cardiolipin synthase
VTTSPIDFLHLLLFERIGLGLLTPVGIVIALAVSLHVLRTKRDPAAALGWMGLGWFAPFAGGTLYLLFGINRVSRRASRLRPHGRIARTEAAPPLPPGAAHLAPLARAGSALAAHPLLAGNAGELLPNGDEAYPHMLSAIAEARHSIALESFILRDDAAGEAFIAALIAAHRRGVAVRVLIDGIGSGYFRAPAARILGAAGVPVARFMHSVLPWRMPLINLRTHRKILVVDGSVAFTGGMNISADNILARHPRHPVRDLHFRLAGPVVADLMLAFATDWAFAHGENLAGSLWFPPLAPAGTTLARVITSGPDADNQKIEMLMLQAIACAHHSIAIQTPYFLPDERAITALALAAARGITVDIVLPTRSDHRFMDWALAAHVTPLLEAGCRLWHNAPPFDHTKLMVVDDSWALIGSANWDMRSLRLNFEVNVEFYDEALARRLAHRLAGNQQARLTRADLAARSPLIRLRDAATRLALPYL